MAISKRTWRKDLEQRIGDFLPVVTTSAGNVGGTTFISTMGDGYSDKVFRSMWATSQGAAEYRSITNFAGTSPATWTVTPAFSGQIGTQDTVEITTWRPDYYTQAANRAIRMAYPSLYLPYLDSTYTVPAAGSPTISTSSAANPTVITTATAHGLATGNAVTITGHSVAAVNGTWLVTVTGSTTFTVPVTSTGGTGGVATIQSNIFAMPTGLTKQMIKQVSMEGQEPFAGRPYNVLDDVSFSPDETQIWLNRTNPHRYRMLTASRKLYLFAQKYLTPLDADGTYGVLSTDTTARIELDAASDYYELLLAFGKWAIFDVMAENPQNQLRGEMRSAADRALAVATQMANLKRMPVIENPYVASNW